MTTPQRKFTIGRDHTCDIPLADDSISRYHAEFAFIGKDKLLMTDCGSTNGTFLLQSYGGERRLRQEQVSLTDRIKFGDVVLSVKELLEALRLKFPQFEKMPDQSSPQLEKPWVQGRRLIRCACGCIKPEGKPCLECGR